MANYINQTNLDNLTDGQPANAGDVKAPLAALDDKLHDVANGSEGVTPNIIGGTINGAIIGSYDPPVATVQRLTAQDTAWTQVVVSNTNDGSYPIMKMSQARGTPAAPASVNQWDVVGNYYGEAYDGSQYVVVGGVLMSIGYNWSGSSHDGELAFIVSRGSENYGHEALRVDANNILQLQAATTTPGSVNNMVKIWNDSGELKVIDENGNITTLSSHNPTLVDTAGRPTSYTHVEANSFTGKHVELDIYRALEMLEELTGELLIHTQELPVEEQQNWNEAETQNEAAREQQRARWAEMSAAEHRGPEPARYNKRPEPARVRAGKQWRDRREKDASKRKANAVVERLKALLER